MNGRGYDPRLGRFLTVDPFIQSPTNTQSINPYTYIFNNPLSGTDPTGYKSEEPDRKEPEINNDCNSSAQKASCRLHDNRTNSSPSNGHKNKSAGALKKTLTSLKAGMKSAGVNGMFNSTISYAKGAYDELRDDLNEVWSVLDGVDKGMIIEESMYLGLNSIGTVAGGIMVLLPEPTTATKWLGGALLSKSLAGGALNITNIREALSGGRDYMPSSLAGLITKGSSNNAKAVATAVDLAIDFSSGRAAANAVIKHIPLTGKYGTSKHLTEPLTVQKYMGKAAEKSAAGLTIGQSSVIILDSAQTINRSLDR